jgi:hypothetical protein
MSDDVFQLRPFEEHPNHKAFIDERDQAVQQLRNAARLITKLAASAPLGRWVDRLDRFRSTDEQAAANDVQWIATMSPLLAPFLAGWLRSAASSLEQSCMPAELECSDLDARMFAALVLAVAP